MIEDKNTFTTNKYSSKNEPNYKFNSKTKNENTSGIKGKSNSQYDVKKLLNIGTVNDKTQKLFNMYQSNSNMNEKRNYLKK